MNLRLWGILVAICCFAATPLLAVPIAVPNFSFESPDVADGTASTTITGWSPPATGGGVHDQQNAQYAGATGNNSSLPGTASGGQDAFLSLGVDTGGSGGFTSMGAFNVTTIAADTRYFLTVALGNRLDADPGLIGLGFLVGFTQTPPLFIPSASIPNGTFTDFSTSIGPFPAGDPNVGSPLGIALSMQSPPHNTQQLEGNFDNVRLDAVAIPEPSTMLLLAMAVALFPRRCRGLPN